MGAVMICSRWMRDWSAQCPYCRHLGEKHPPHGRTRDCEECRRRAAVAAQQQARAAADSIIIIVTPVGTGATARQPDVRMVRKWLA